MTINIVGGIASDGSERADKVHVWAYFLGREGERRKERPYAVVAIGAKISNNKENNIVLTRGGRVEYLRQFKRMNSAVLGKMSMMMLISEKITMILLAPISLLILITDDNRAKLKKRGSHSQKAFAKLHLITVNFCANILHSF